MMMMQQPMDDTERSRGKPMMRVRATAGWPNCEYIYILLLCSYQLSWTVQSPNGRFWGSSTNQPIMSFVASLQVSSAKRSWFCGECERQRGRAAFIVMDLTVASPSVFSAALDLRP